MLALFLAYFLTLALYKVEGKDLLHIGCRDIRRELAHAFLHCGQRTALVQDRHLLQVSAVHKRQARPLIHSRDPLASSQSECKAYPMPMPIAQVAALAR